MFSAFTEGISSAIFFHVFRKKCVLAERRLCAVAGQHSAGSQQEDSSSPFAGGFADGAVLCGKAVLTPRDGAV